MKRPDSERNRSIFPNYGKSKARDPAKAYLLAKSLQGKKQGLPTQGQPCSHVPLLYYYFCGLAAGGVAGFGVVAAGFAAAGFAAGAPAG